MTEHARLRTRRYASVAVRWLGLAALVFALTMAFGAFITDHVMKKIYKASVVMEIEPLRIDSVESSTWFSSPAQEALRAEVETIESPTVLEPVIAQLDLTAAWAARLYRQSDPIATDEAVRYLKSSLRVVGRAGSDIVDLDVYSDDPREAAAVANAVAESYARSRKIHSSSPIYVGSAVNPVRILARAKVPSEPARPDRIFCYGVTTALAAALAVMLATCVEVVLLIVRAEQAQRALEPIPVHH